VQPRTRGVPVPVLPEPSVGRGGPAARDHPPVRRSVREDESEVVAQQPGSRARHPERALRERVRHASGSRYADPSSGSRCGAGHEDRLCVRRRVDASAQRTRRQPGRLAPARARLSQMGRRRPLRLTWGTGRPRRAAPESRPAARRLAHPQV
ncbi:MAG: Bis(5'-nucleosyl)-tetraphosphatase (asymmetrical), partial [uncultured Acidimicrobiales bacterium]